MKYWVLGFFLSLSMVSSANATTVRIGDRTIYKFVNTKCSIVGAQEKSEVRVVLFNTSHPDEGSLKANVSLTAGVNLIFTDSLSRQWGSNKEIDSTSGCNSELRKMIYEQGKLKSFDLSLDCKAQFEIKDPGPYLDLKVDAADPIHCSLS